MLQLLTGASRKGPKGLGSKFPRSFKGVGRCQSSIHHQDWSDPFCQVCQTVTHVMRECGLEPLQFNWFQAAVRLYNALTQSNSFTVRKNLQADMQLSSRCDDCWSSHTLSAVNGFTQSYLFKERLLKCEPINLGRFIVDLRERHLDYWTPYSGMHPRERNSKSSTYHQWCALLTMRALVTHSPYTLPRYMLLDLPRDVIRSVACLRPRALTLQIEIVTWTHDTYPTCDLCNANDVQDVCLFVCLSVCLLQDASGHSNVLKAGKAEELKTARKRRTARKANKLRVRPKGYKDSSG